MCQRAGCFTLLVSLLSYMRADCLNLLVSLLSCVRELAASLYCCPCCHVSESWLLYFTGVLVVMCHRAGCFTLLVSLLSCVIELAALLY